MKSTKRLITELADRLSHIEKMVEVMYMMDTIQPEKPKRGRATGTRGGFAANPELAKRAGRLGGSRSKRGSEQEIRWVLVHKPTGDIVGEYPFKTVADKKRAELYGDKAYEYEAVRKKKGD